jgi:hypothetical protein
MVEDSAVASGASGSHRRRVTFRRLLGTLLIAVAVVALGYSPVSPPRPPMNWGLTSGRRLTLIESLIGTRKPLDCCWSVRISSSGRSIGPSKGPPRASGR